MGIRVKKAIGYGMTIDEFKNFSPLYEKIKDTDGEMYEFLDSTKEVLKTSSDDFKESYALHERQYLHFDPLTKDNNNSLYDMVHFIGYEEGSYTDVLFIPSERFIKQWYRHDDGIDYAEERWFGGNTRSDDIGRSEDIVKYVTYGHYPYSNNLMGPDGSYEAWRCYKEPEGKELSILPCPPAELVYWTQKTDMLNKNGVLKLKPMIATWWS